MSKAEAEKALRGSHEAFSESVKLNTALLRKRIRSTRLKVEENFLGVRSNTVTALVYMEDLVRLESFEIPYLMPFVAAGEAGVSAFADGILRKPLQKLTKRPVFTRPGARVRYRQVPAPEAREDNGGVGRES